MGVFRLAYARTDNESSTWDSTRLRNFVVFVMRSFWQFVSCPATQNATCNIFAADRNFSKIPCNKMQRFQPYRNSQSRYCHTKIHENSWKLKKNPKISMDAINQEESRRHNIFNQSESSITLLSSATLLALYSPHLHLNSRILNRHIRL